MDLNPLLRKKILTSIARRRINTLIFYPMTLSYKYLIIKNWCLLSLIIVTSYDIFAQNNTKMLKLARKLGYPLTKQAKLLQCKENYIFERIAENQYLERYFYFNSTQIYKMISYQDEKQRIKHGKTGEWNADGKPIYEGNYDNNELSGEWKYYYPNTNQLQCYGEYVQGEHKGTWTCLDLQGNTEIKYFYNQPDHLGEIQLFNPQGIIIQKARMNKSKRRKIDYYDDEGKLLETEILEEKPSKYVATYNCSTAQQLKTEEEIAACSGQEMYAFLVENIYYPNYAKENGIMGKVYISFVIHADGSLGSMMSIRKIDSSLMFEALRVIAMMSLWNPIKLHGKSRPSFLVLPINFELQ